MASIDGRRAHGGSIRASCPSSAGQRIPVRGRAVMEARRWTAAREGCGRCRGLGPARADHSVYVERCARELGAPPPHHAFTVTAAPALRQRSGRSAAGGAQDVVHFAYVTACRPDLALCLLLGSPEDAALPDRRFPVHARSFGSARVELPGIRRTESAVWLFEQVDAQVVVGFRLPITG